MKWEEERGRNEGDALERGSVWRNRMKEGLGERRKQGGNGGRGEGRRGEMGNE